MLSLTRPEGSRSGDFDVSRRLFGGVFFAGYAAFAVSAQADPIRTDEQGLVTGVVQLPAADRTIPAYLARPDRRGRRPVVVVVSEVFGVHEYIRDVCRRLARAGYAAIAPAFFVRVADPAGAEMARVQEIVAAAGYEQVMGDVAATLDWASQQLWANADKVGITGWCWGGKVVWQAAARFAAIDAGVAWYGRLAPPADATPERAAAGAPWPVDLADDLKAPVLGLYGEADRGIPLDTVEAMRAALQRAGQTDSGIEVYPGAPHGFHADYRDSYRPADAADGWAKLLALFEARLKG